MIKTITHQKMIIKTQYISNKYLMFAILFLLFVTAFSLTSQQMDVVLKDFFQKQSLMGLAVQITKNSSTIYRGNFGHRDYQNNLTINNDTCFRMASLSKNVAALGLYQLIQQGKLSLTDSLSSRVGFNVVNPYFPNTTITIEMLLSHQSTIQDCSAVYDGFLTDMDLALNVSTLPKLQSLFTPGNKFYSNCTFNNKKPGTHYSYSNLGYILVGNIIQKTTGIRFDTWMSNNYLKNIGSPSYNPATLPNISNLAVIYQGLGGNWVPSHDYYQGKYQQKNLTGYVPGTNAGVYYPHAGLRATTDQMLQHINLIRQGGKGALKADSIKDIVKPRYQYHGLGYGQCADWHYYGLGLYTTGYYRNDKVLENRVTVGHTGSGYGLISGMYYTGDYAFSYVINGILHGYTYDSNQTIYQLQRKDLSSYIGEFINTN